MVFMKISLSLIADQSSNVPLILLSSLNEISKVVTTDFQRDHIFFLKHIFSWWILLLASACIERVSIPAPSFFQL